jgi:hypothetical protein
LTYRYMIIAWNDASVRAMIDHNDAEHFCRTGEPHGDDNFFVGENTGAADATTTALSSFPSFLRNPGFATGRQVAVLPRGFVFAWGGKDGGATIIISSSSPTTWRASRRSCAIRTTTRLKRCSTRG